MSQCTGWQLFSVDCLDPEHIPGIREDLVLCAHLSTVVCCTHRLSSLSNFQHAIESHSLQSAASSRHSVPCHTHHLLTLLHARNLAASRAGTCTSVHRHVVSIDCFLQLYLRGDARCHSFVRSHAWALLTEQHTPCRLLHMADRGSVLRPSFPGMETHTNCNVITTRADGTDGSGLLQGILQR